jgi:hypothetical protein
LRKTTTYPSQVNYDIFFSLFLINSLILFNFPA